MKKEIENKTIGKKHDILKHMVTFSLQEKRLLGFCLTKYDSIPGAKNPRFFKVPIDELKNAFPELSNQKNAVVYQAFTDAVLGIQSKPFIPDPTKNMKIFYFEMIDMVNDEIHWELTQSISRFFLELKGRFISYKFKYINRIKSASTWNLYEYIKEKFMEGQQGEWFVPVLELRDRLGVLGKYKTFNSFYRRCIEKQIEEINNLTELKVEDRKVKQGRTVIKIKFIVEKKPLDDDFINGDPDTLKLIENLTNLKIYKPVAEKLATLIIDSNKLSEIEGQFQRIQTAAMQKKNPAGYAITSIRNILNSKGLFDEPKPKIHSDIEKQEAMKKFSQKDLITLAENGNIPAFEELQRRGIDIMSIK